MKTVPAADVTILVARLGVPRMDGSDDMPLAVLDHAGTPVPWRHSVEAEFTGQNPKAVLRQMPVDIADGGPAV